MNELIAALTRATGFEVVSHTEQRTRLRLIGRAPDTRRPDMMALINTLHDNIRTSWSVDVSKLYFRPEGFKQCVWAWRFIFETKKDALPYSLITATIQSVHPTAPSSAPLSAHTVPLPGANANRNHYNARGKGAALMGQAVVGANWRGQ